MKRQITKQERLRMLAIKLSKLEPGQLRWEWEMPTVPTKDSPGCPLGWALTIKEFQKEGLKGSHYGNRVYLTYSTGEIKKEGLAASMVFFGLSFEEAWKLFTPPYWRSVDINKGATDKIATMLMEIANRDKTE